ncbi:hypothetical protein PtA15_5A33 [Puccinia triticina]|uniref:cAMP-independent regulatory protein pac2 n=1 Tax=Puccinia triticina TaxID=208348 RepID=A0ABY7CJC6_9BASI|nr:uncharacterized protein PtA15_5A33 [Puccinia triticina]WAQ84463.1 hypothetical protein PtA15_5A33 [Puccinia triticina]
MNPNLNNPSGIHQHHQTSHSVSQLQPSLHPLHSHTHLPPAHTLPAHSHLPHQSHQHQQHPSNPAPIRDPLDRQQQQRSNIEHYKSSAEPAYSGYIGSTHDALIIFSGCYLGDFPMVSRRLHERERRSIRSGSVYVFDETKAGIKRWTDGRVWSPSRILNNFLVYREIDQKRPTANTNNPGGSASNPSSSTAGPPPTTSAPTTNTAPKHEEDSGNHLKSATTSAASHHPAGPSQSNSQYNRHHSTNPAGHSASQTENRNSNQHSSLDSKSSIPKDENQEQTQAAAGENSDPPASNQRPMNRERERSLVGSLTSTYKFRQDGLVKKTISIAGMHMISYYKLDDVVSGRLRTPTSHASMLHIQIVAHLLNPSFYRAPPQYYMSNGRIWIQEEGPEETTSIPSTVSSAAPSLHNVPRHGALPLPASGSTSSNPPQAIRTTHPPARPDASEGITSAALSRPGSSDSSTGSPSAASPTSPHSFLLLSTSNLNNPGAAPRSPVMNTVGGRPSFPRVHNSHNTSTSSGSGPLGRSSTMSGASSTRYEPYPRAARSPPLSASSTTNSTMTDQQTSVHYFSPNQTTGGLNGYSTHSFLSDSHASPLVGSDQQPGNNRNTRNDSSANDGRNLESVGQVGGYDESATYRPATSTNVGGECLYTQYTITDPANNSHRSSSVPPPSYGLPSINRLGASGQPGSPSSSTGTRTIGDYQFTGSSNQPQTSRLSPATGSHGGSYGGYLSPAVADNTFRGTTGGSALPERENHAYGSSSHSTNSLTNSSGQASSAAGTQSGSFLYPPASTSPNSSYQFNNPARRGSAMATLSGEISNSSADSARGGPRINSQNRPNGSGLHMSENSNGASHWGQMGSSHAMKKEEGAGG